MVMEPETGWRLESFTSPDVNAEMRHLTIDGCRLVVGQPRIGLTTHLEARNQRPEIQT